MYWLPGAAKIAGISVRSFPGRVRLVGRRLGRARFLGFSPSPRRVVVWRDAALDLLFPPRCAVCERNGSPLCALCVEEFVRADGNRCPRCWSPVARGSSQICATCQTDPPSFDGLRGAFVYEGNVRDAVLALKYEGLSSLDRPLVAEVDLDAVTPKRAVVDVVTAVPMSGRRRRRRGYNQAEALGRALATRLEIPFDGDLLLRVRHVPQQARQPDLTARRTNVAGAFAADRRRAQGRGVLVVDDVTTSGATLGACAEALRDVEARAVYTWALARED